MCVTQLYAPVGKKGWDALKFKLYMEIVKYLNNKT